ncbi:MAG TPA: L,D-transpeptidase [Rhizobiaceae bacterium]|nr:L,D-transpeptidase [Rhizobiaceae bacterium]
MLRIFSGLALGFLATAVTVTAAQAASLVAHVDISSQTMTVSHNGRMLYHWPVSTGRSGFRTPTGKWRPTRMHKMWYSRKYDNSPMPYSIFFKGGYAIHGTNYVKSLGAPASHGCVRLHTANARELYNLTRAVGPKNMRVIITR